MSTSPNKSHILVDLDGTLASYDKWRGVEHIGEPIAPMLDRVKKWLEAGEDVRIFTARVFPVIEGEDVNARLDVSKLATMTDLEIRGWQTIGFVREWCSKHIGRALPITCRKNFETREIWDDRAIGVMLNKGVEREVFLQWQLKRLAEAAGMTLETGMQFAPVVDRASAMIRSIRDAGESAQVNFEAARDLLEELNLDGLPEEAARNIRYARVALMRLGKNLESLNPTKKAGE